MKRPVGRPLSNPLAKTLLRLRWAILAFALSVILLETFEDAFDFDPRLPEILIFGLTIPAVGWLLLTIMAANIQHRAESETKLQRHQQFVQSLEHCQGWNELARFVVEFPGTLLPVDHTSLCIYDHRQARIKFVTEWTAMGAAHSPVSRYLASSSVCANCLATKSPQLRNTAACVAMLGLIGGDTSEYCLPLTYDKLLVGTLRLRCRADQSLGREQVDFLHTVAPEIALALAVSLAQPRQVRRIQMEAQLDERRTIAYDLHNLLAQQAGYLHLNLDRLGGDRDLLMAEAVRQELQQLRDVAGEVYEQIRSYLVELRSPDLSDLTTTITRYAGIITRRAQLSINVRTTGTPTALLPSYSQKVFGLLREGLNNIEKHARAGQVQVLLNWSSDELRIELVDDGIGFDQRALDNDHYGLIMMREQANELGGEVTVESAPGRGTSLKVILPLSQVLTAYTFRKSEDIQPAERN